MSVKSIFLTISLLIFCCFFQNAQGDYTREQLENYFEQPVFSYVHMMDFIVINQWLYTTELSKILLVGDDVLLQCMQKIPFIGFMFVNVAPICNNRFFDTRFESFIKNIGKSSQHELQEAIKHAILLSSANTHAYSTHTLLDGLIKALQYQIMIIKDQIKHNFKYEQKALNSMKKSLALASVLIASIVITNKYCSCADKKVNKTLSNAAALNTVARLSLLPTSYKVLTNYYKILTTDPNANNKYLDEFETLLTFIQELKTDLKTKGTLILKLSNGRIAIYKEENTFVGPIQYITLT